MQGRTEQQHSMENANNAYTRRCDKKCQRGGQLLELLEGTMASEILSNTFLICFCFFGLLDPPCADSPGTCSWISIDFQLFIDFDLFFKYEDFQIALLFYP